MGQGTDLRGDQNWLLEPQYGEKGVPRVGPLGVLRPAAGRLGVAESPWSERVQPSVTYQSPGRSEGVPAGVRGREWDKKPVTQK